MAHIVVIHLYKVCSTDSNHKHGLLLAASSAALY